jgi:hypothetical protein
VLVAGSFCLWFFSAGLQPMIFTPQFQAASCCAIVSLLTSLAFQAQSSQADRGG